MTTQTYPEPLPVGSPPPQLPEKDPEEDFIRQLYNSKINYDNRPVSDLIKSVAQKTSINPSLLFSSAIQEGLNYAVTRPDEISEAYGIASDAGEIDGNTFPVDGFYNYGLDRFGEDYSRLKKYLPEGFEQRFKPFKAKNEKGESITTAAFQTNEDALIAKSAVLKHTQEQIDSYAKKKGFVIPEEDKDYFVLAAYNSGIGRGKTILDEYIKAKDKRKFIDEGLTTKKEVHNNIAPRLKRMRFLTQLMSEQTQPTQ